MNALSGLLPAVFWWLVSFVLIVTSQTSPGVHDVPLLEPAQDSQIAEMTAWHAPLTIYWPWQTGRRISVWTASALAAALITFVTATLRTATTPLLGGLVLICLSSVADISHVLAAVATAGVTAAAMTFLQSPENRALRNILMRMIFALFVTIDFGLSLFVAIPVVILNLVQKLAGRKGKSVSTWFLTSIAVSALMLASLTIPGFAAALVRPWSSLLAPNVADILPSLGSPFSGDAAAGNIVALLLLTTVTIIHIARLRGTSDAWMAWLPSCLITAMLLAVGCATRHYFWISMVAVAASVRFASKPDQVPFSNARSKTATLVILVLAAMHVCLNVVISGNSAGDWVIPQRSANTTELKVSGPILLMNLDQSSDWAFQIPGDATLLATNRWDVPGDQLLEYCLACRDIGFGRKEQYRKADGHWGGYRSFLSRYSPSAIVVDSSDLLVLRHLSVDPDWGLVAIDARRTVFRRLDNPQARTQSGRAMSLCYWLEWPAARAPSAPDGILQLGTDADNRVIGSIMNAIRLPYAALRMLPTDDHDQTILVMTQAYSELALRSQRQMAQSSLIDLYRTSLGGQGLNSLWQLTYKQKLLRDTLRDSITEFESSLRRSEFQSSHHADRDRVAGQGSKSAHGDPDFVVIQLEDSIRDAIQFGLLPEARSLLADLQDGPIRDFYEALLLEVNQHSALRRLEQVVQSGRLPERLQSEGHFYIGCLAIEAREPRKACSHFSSCLASETGSRFAGLCNMYLQRLACQ